MLSSKSKKAFAILLTLTMVFGFGVTSLFADTIPDPNKPVSLTVQKYVTPVPSTTPGDGINGPTGGQLTLAQGVEFSLTLLTGVTVDTTVENCSKGAFVLTGTTDSNGQIVWNTANNQLQQGFYLLEETKSPFDGTVNQYNPTGILAAKSASSIVALPFTNATEYIYDVKVFPKNVGEANTKTVANPESVYKPGDIVTWEIKTAIASQLVESYKIVDELDSRLTCQSATVSMQFSSGSPAVALDAAGDYTVDVDSNNVVTITLTSSGLAKVKAQGATSIKTAITTVINDSAFTNANDAPIVNSADLVFKNTGDATEKTITIPDPAIINLAKIEIEKVDGKDTTKKLEGAEFKMALTKEDALASKFIKKGADDMVLTTGADGKAYASGIPFELIQTDSNGNQFINVYLVEVKAPGGYDLLQESVVLGKMQPVVFEITLAKGADQVIDGVTYNPFSGFLQIKNFKGFELPITGGAGTILFTVIGAALIIGAGVLLFVTRRKKATVSE